MKFVTQLFIFLLGPTVKFSVVAAAAAAAAAVVVVTEVVFGVVFLILMISQYLSIVDDNDIEAFLKSY